MQVRLGSRVPDGCCARLSVSFNARLTPVCTNWYRPLSNHPVVSVGAHHRFEESCLPFAGALCIPPTNGTSFDISTGLLNPVVKTIDSVESADRLLSKV